MGGGSSSSRSSNTTNNTNSQVSLAGDNEGLILSNVSGSTISITDHNAINEAMRLAGDVIDQSGENLRTTNALIEHNTGQVFDFADDVLAANTRSTDKAFDFASKNTNTAFDAITGNLKQALAFVNTANSPDGGLTVDIIRPLAYGSAAVAAAYILSRAVK
ncbi:hypothetical protein [Endozoicomonas montiporae]|uniref:Uncharacterized protein n=1 Tax=Endozoicomonas montiporae CL-33 TaxID=570277 RepID=A0A142BD02_9GAMM|nr:hypothetical protein [Endozoicomonas montiporae]AMO56628.1 hypothetical protein EZMO1_2549 [Endozoicomonas montiporae CL-33]